MGKGNVKVLTIVGARPQFVKAAAVSRILRRKRGVTEVLVHTGQHFDENMSAVFFEELRIPQPDYNLGVSGGGHGVQTGRMLEAIEAVLLDERPDWVLVYGDTNSTLAGALAAAKLHVPVVHVEAGLRSYNRRMPEEVNRVLTDHVSDLLLCPTEAAVENLRTEGLAEDRIRLVGDVMYDVSLFYRERADHESRIVEDLGLVPGTYVLATIHRAENTDAAQRIRALAGALKRLGESMPVVLPLHPRTRAALVREGIATSGMGAVRVIDPVGYLDMIRLEKCARLVATDSGGVQKEAFFFGVPCVTLRDETEWMELVTAGWNHLVSPTSPEDVVERIRAVLDAPAPSDPPPLYGRGDAAEHITNLLVSR